MRYSGVFSSPLFAISKWALGVQQLQEYLKLRF